MNLKVKKTLDEKGATCFMYSIDGGKYTSSIESKIVFDGFEVINQQACRSIAGLSDTYGSNLAKMRYGEYENTMEVKQLTKSSTAQEVLDEVVNRIEKCRQWVAQCRALAVETTASRSF